MQKLQKMKILGKGCYGINDAEYDTVPRAFEGQWHRRHPLYTDSDDYLKVFNVEHDSSDRWLNSNYGKPDNAWYPDNRWVFLAPRTT